jgi:hypothetical protein
MRARIPRRGDVLSLDDPTEPREGDPVDEAALERVMNEVPRGALALSALTVGLLLLAWFLIYALVFLPRGTVG